MPRPRRETECPADPAAFDLEHFLPYRLSLLTNTVSQGIARGYRESHDISVTEWRILAVLGRYPGLTANDLAARTAMDKVAISRAVKSLVEKNLLQRSTDGEDRRKRRHHLTPGRGAATLREIVPMAHAYEQALLTALTPRERQTFHRLLKKLHHQASCL